jgi:FtsP/CotA-like multicopper oxidase with cupredoxin domain/peroxiredoxin
MVARQTAIGSGSRFLDTPASSRISRDFKRLRLPLLVAGLLGAACGPVRGQELQGFDQRKKASVQASETSFVTPAAVTTAAGVCRTVLQVMYGDTTVDLPPGYFHAGEEHIRLRLRSYNGQLAGPTLRVHPGDLLRIRLLNQLPDQSPDDRRRVAHGDGPHEFNVTNLHTHGLHVSPDDPADNAFLEIRPGQTHEYEFQIPKDHPAGTLWYHPHKHGSVGVQVASGMSGALIVEGGLDEIPEIKAAAEKIFLIQQIPFRLDEKRFGVIDTDFIYPDPEAGCDAPQLLTLINGALEPVIEMAPGEVQRWRFIHAGIVEHLKIALIEETGSEEREHPVDEIAVDGLALGRRITKPTVDLYPGYRSDVLVTAGDSEGVYYLIDEESTELESLRNDRGTTTESRHYLARIMVRGKPRKMSLPSDTDLARCKPFRPIADDEIAAGSQFELKFEYRLQLMPNGKKEERFLINGQTMGSGDLVRTVRLNTAEEWTLNAAQGKHPFHIHVNPFEVIVRDDSGRIVDRVWRDTLFVPARKKATIRLRFLDFTGKSVMHCHILDHAENGMMRAFRIDAGAGRALDSGRAGKGLGLAELPRRAPAWELFDTEGRRHLLTDFAGRNLALVFVRSLGCLHCSRQIQSLAARRPLLDEAGLTVVLVSADGPDALLNAKVEDPEGTLLPFLTLSDAKGNVFRDFGCSAGGALQHGTFLIDRHGDVRWQNVGPEPYMDVESLAQLGRQFASGSNRLADDRGPAAVAPPQSRE